MSEDEQITGLSDNVYNLSSVLFHAAEGSQVYDKYIEDTERTGDQELVEFFREVRDEDARRSQRTKSLLDQR
jgi:hypothetical protein